MPFPVAESLSQLFSRYSAPTLQRVLISAKPPTFEFCRKAYFVMKVLLSDCQIWPSCCKWKIFSRTVLTLNFDLDLSKINSDIWLER